MNTLIGCAALLLIFFMSTSFGAMYSGHFNDPKNPGKCTIRENLILSPGDIVKDPNQACARILCGGNGMATFHTCGLHSVIGCKLGDYVDQSLPYPGCCKRKIICD